MNWIMSHRLLLLLLSVISVFNATTVFAQQLTPEKQQEVDSLSQQIKANPNDYFLFVQRGFIYKKAGKISAAFLDFDRALALDPKWQQGYFLRAEKFKQEGKLADAMNEISHAERVGKLNANELSFRGKINADMKNFNAAEKDYTDAISLDPSYAPAYMGRALLNIDKKAEVGKIIPDLENAVRLNPSDALGKKILQEYRARGISQ